MATKRSLKIILDTNWYISASINRNSRRTLYELLIHPELKIFYSDQLIHEFREVIARPRFRKLISEPQVLRFLKMVLPRLKPTGIRQDISVSRDPEDNYLLGIAHECGADFLVTGDVDLLVLRKFGATKILKMSEFHMVLAASS